METIITSDEHALYPIHEEDTVVQGPRHARQCRYLTGALQALRPDLWVLHDVCLYWEPGNMQLYRAPDVAVINCPPPIDPPNVYLAWRDAPLLFVAEVVSDATRREDWVEKRFDYERHLRAPEYLYSDPKRNERRLWRLDGGAYQPVRPDRQGRVWSVVLDVAFGYDASGFLRIYTRDGEMLLTHEEERWQRQEAERLAEAEAQRAQLETERRAEAEQQLAQLTAELERLRQLGGEAG